MSDGVYPHGPDEQAENAAADRERLRELLRQREKARSAGKRPEPNGGNAGAAKEEWTPLIPIQAHGTKPPFFIVHAILGSVFPYHRLALALGAERPVYGLQSRGLNGGHPPIETIPEMAEVYVRAVREVQQEGPYHLGGYSMGGWIAYEMAQRLREAGERVDVLAVIGTPAPLASHFPGAEIWRWITTYVADFFSLWRNAAIADSTWLQGSMFGDWGSKGSDPRNPSGAGSSGAASGPNGTEGATGAWPFGAGFAELGPIYRVALTNAAAQLRYVADASDVGVDIFLTPEQSILYRLEPTMGWSSLCGEETAVYHVQGNHLNLFQEPQVLELAQILSQRLDGEAGPRGWT